MRYSAADFVDTGDARRAATRSPHARQLCQGSNRELATALDTRPASAPVECPYCLRKAATTGFARDGASWHPIVPSHLADQAGLLRAASRARDTSAQQNRPY